MYFFTQFCFILYFNYVSVLSFSALQATVGCSFKVSMPLSHIVFVNKTEKIFPIHDLY